MNQIRVSFILNYGSVAVGTATIIAADAAVTPAATTTNSFSPR